jgi:hypothetical protein
MMIMTCVKGGQGLGGAFQGGFKKDVWRRLRLWGAF